MIRQYLTRSERVHAIRIDSWDAVDKATDWIESLDGIAGEGEPQFGVDKVLSVRTPEGEEYAGIGDWLVLKGDAFRVLSDEAFWATYIPDMGEP